MRLSDPLNDRQLAVLRWLADGCPDGVYDQPVQYKHTAAALRDRRLVTISRAGRTWQACLTERGRHYLEHESYPESPAQPSRAQAASNAPTTTARTTPTVPPPMPPTPSVAELLQRLDNGPMVVSDPTPAERAAWRRLLHATRRSDEVPADHYLVHRGRDRGDLGVELREGRDPMQEEALPQNQLEVYVPDEVNELHPLLTRLGQGAATSLRVSEPALPRALRLLHALITETESRGCTVSLSKAPDTAFDFVRADASCGLTVYEEYHDRPVLPAAEELAAAKSYAWQRVQARKLSLPTGRLVLDVGQDLRFSGNRHRWADRQRWNLEDKLGKVLSEILHRLEATNQRQAAERHEEEQRNLDWKAAMSQARQAFQDAARADVLEAQLADWDKAQRIRAFCAAAAAVGPLDGNVVEHQTWLDWAMAYADDIDPRLGPLRMPSEQTPRPDDLRPFLNGWSPFEPKRSRF